MFAEVEQVVVPAILTPNWWNIELATNKGDEIVGMLRRFYGRPLTRQPYVPELGTALPLVLADLGVHPKEISFNPYEHQIDVLVRGNMHASFSLILTEFFERNRTREMVNLFEPVWMILETFWEDLEKSRSPELYLRNAAECLVRDGFMRALCNFILFSVCGQRRFVMTHRTLLEFYEKGNFPLGQLKSRTDRHHFLVYLAKPLL